MKLKGTIFLEWMLFMALTSTFVSVGQCKNKIDGSYLTKQVEVQIDKPTWDEALLAVNRLTPVIAGQVPKSEPIVPAGKKTLLEFLDAFTAANGLQWHSLDRISSDASPVIVLSKQLDDDVSPYVPVGDTEIKWRHIYILLQFLDTLPSSQKQLILSQPLEIKALSLRSKNALKDLVSCFHVSQRYPITSEPKGSTLQHGSSLDPDEIIKFISVQLTPMVTISLPQGSLDFGLMPWSKVSYRDIIHTGNRRFAWVESKDTSFTQNASSVDLPSSDEMLPRVLKDPTHIVVKEDGFKSVVSLFGLTDPEGKKILFEESVRDQSAYVAAGTYSTGFLRTAVLRACGLELRELGTEKRTVFIAPLRQALVSDTHIPASLHNIEGKLTGLWADSLVRALNDMNYPVTPKELWCKRRPISAFSASQRKIIIERWIEIERISQSMRNETASDDILGSSKSAEKYLIESNALLTITPAIVINGSIYRSSNGNSLRWKSFWEARLLI